MKNIYLLILASFVLFTSCDNEVDELFELSSQERINEATQEYKDILTAPENGWLIEVIPTDEAMGAFNAYAKFTKEGMSYLSNDFNAYRIEAVTDSSLYKVGYTQGMTITFTTFSQMNYFSNPNNSWGAGKGGDIELLVKEISDEEIVCEGKVNKGSYIFRKAGVSDHTAALQEIMNMETKMIRQTYLSDYAFPSLILDDGKKISFSYNAIRKSVRVSTFLETAEGLVEDVVYHKIRWDNKGLTLLDPITVDGEDITRLDYNADEDAFKTPSDQVQAVFRVDPWPPVQIKGMGEKFNEIGWGDVVRYSRGLQTKVNDFGFLYPDFKKIVYCNQYYGCGWFFNTSNYWPFAIIKDKKATVLDEDVIAFEYDGCNNRYYTPFKLEDRLATPEGQVLKDILFSEKGFRLFTSDNENIYLISMDDPSNWLIINV